MRAASFPAFQRRLVAAVVLSACIFALLPVQAADKTWDGEGVDSNWQTPENWDPTGGGGVAPVPNDSLFFDGNANTSPNNDFPANTFFNSITFNSNASSFTLTGSGIFLNNAGGSATAQNLGGSITNNSANSQAILFPVILADGKHLIVNNGAGHLVFDSPIYRGLSVSNDPVVVQFLKTGAGDVLISTNYTVVYNGIMGGWALFGTNWATVDGSTVVAYSNYTDIGGNGSIPNDPTANVRITAGSSTATLNSNLTEINSLYFGVSANETVNLNGKTLRLGAYGGVSRGAATTAALTIGTAGPTNGVFTAGGAENTDGEIVFDAGSGANTINTITINSQITDNGSGKVKLIKTGQAAVRLDNSTSNNFSGGTYIAQGQLRAAIRNCFGSSGVFVSSGGQAYLFGSSLLVTNDFFIAGLGTTEGFGFGAIRFAGGTTNSGNITLTGDARIGGGATANPANISGKITGNFNLEFGTYSTINGTIILSSTNNDWGGDTTIIGKTNSGGGFNILRLGASEVIPNSGGAGNIFISGSQITIGGALDLNGFNETINGLTALPPVNNAIVTNSSATAATLTVGDNAATSTFGGSIKSGNGVINLTKVGSGILTLTNVNTYTGDTTISGGKLLLSGAGSISNSLTITVGPGANFDVGGVSAGCTLAAGQTLTGSGTINGTLRISGTIAPGNGVGTINSDPQIWDGGGIYNWQINDATGSDGLDPGWDLVNIGGAVTISAAATNKFTVKIISLNGGTPGDAANFSNTSDYTWRILLGEGAATGFDPGVFNVDSSSFSNGVPAEGRFIAGISGNSRDILIKYGLAPTITSQPTGGTVAAGDSKIFAVSATGSATLTYQWRKNGADIVGAQNDTYTISPVLVSDAGDYTVVVANSFGSVTSSVASLSITCPTIMLSPAILSFAQVGVTYTQTITASGGTVPYSFAVTSGSLPSGLSLPSEGNLSGTPTGPAGIYTFTITATDAFGCSGSKSYNLPVYIAYTNTINTGYNLIANQLDRGGNTFDEIMPSVPDGCYLFKYDNTVGSYLEPALYSSASGRWTHGTIPLNPGEGAFLYSPTNFSLTFLGIPHVPVLPLTSCTGYRLLSRQTNDVGSFDNIIGSAPAGNEVLYRWTGTAYNAFMFDGTFWTPTTPSAAVGESVWIYTPSGGNCSGGANGLNAPPVITTQPQSQTVSIGANVTFTVVATGSGTLTYQWRLNGQNISGETNSTLALLNVQPSNSGNYSVVVANAGGATESKTAQLIVTTASGGFADYFTNSVTTNSAAGSVSGSNTNATKETGEANHAGNTGGKSVWYAWMAPSTGIATFTTLGSSFDTLLAIYKGTNVATLALVTADNDSAGFFASRVKFNAVAGTIYYIAMDGSYGASGDIVLSWSLEVTADVTPQIKTHPQSQAGGPGDSITLSVVATAGTNVLFYQWFKDGNSISDATNASYTISSLNASHIGLYTVRVSVGSRQVFSEAATVQLSTIVLGSVPNIPAADKFLDSVFNDTSSNTNTFFVGNGGKGKGGGSPKTAPAAGFTGTQIFSTVGSSKEPGEPNHCGEPGGASYWFTYQAPASGHLYIDTSNSTFNTVLAIYSGPSVMTNFGSLVAMGCANIAGNGGELVDFEATNGTMYYIAVDGVGGSNGVANLDYNLITAPPSFATYPQSHSVTQGQNGTLTVSMANSTTPLRYQWVFGSTNIGGATNTSYTRTNFQLAHQGNYSVVVTNNGGTNTSGPAMMYLNVPAIRATNWTINSTGRFHTRWFGPTNGMLALQFSTNIASSNWISLKTNTLTNGITTFTDDSALALTNHFYRVRLLFP